MLQLCGIEEVILNGVTRSVEYYIFQSVRDNPDFDNINCLCNLVHVYEKCRDLAKKARGGE